MAEDQVQRKDEPRRIHTYPFIKHSDMQEDMRTEVMELCVTACEKFTTDNEASARFIKEAMDKKFGAAWHSVVGEGYGFEITHDLTNLLYMLCGGNLAIIVWKCS
ncbi:Outer arm dynein light chain 4 [Fasciolopsis buskii]|uniref:Dynein light chain n=1 Tax=Fasciolopsis buskii TaxID=27845 RepID=A0A8E0VHL9_9TREM|nr:Outer arm dynein light chain 4 [Fasciolopsis buski]